MGFSLDNRQIQQALANLVAVDERMTVKAARRGMRKAAKILDEAMVKNTPRQASKPAKVKDTRHMQDTVRVKQKTYRGRKSAPTTVMIVGYASPQVRHAHWVNEGTKPRWTKHSTKDYETIGSVKIKSKGGFRYRRVRRSLGSKRDPNKQGVPHYTGVMPAFRPVQKSLRQTKGAMTSAIVKELQAELGRANFVINTMAGR